jgi:hypothetical protein
VVVVHEDLGALRERLAAHGAGVLLDIQKPVELLLRQPVAGELVLTPPPTPGLGVVPEPDSPPAGGLPSPAIGQRFRCAAVPFGPSIRAQGPLGGIHLPQTSRLVPDLCPLTSSVTAESTTERAVGW